MARTPTPPLLLLTLRDELAECRRQLAHYARLTTTLQLQLETLDRQQTACCRRAQELLCAIEAEELRLATVEAIPPLRTKREAVAV